MFEGMLQFSDSEDEDEAAFQLRTHGFASSIKEAVTVKGKDVIEGEGNKSIIGEQKAITPVSPIVIQTDEFYSQDGLLKFLESEDKDKGKVRTNVEETKAMTRSECKKAGVAPPPASKAACPVNRKTRSVFPKTTSDNTPKTASTKQQTKIVDPKQTPKIKALVAVDAILDMQDPQHQPGSIVVIHKHASPKQTSAKTFAAAASTPKTPISAPPQKVSPKVQTPAKPLRAKTDTKKASPTKGA